ncbi:MAG: CHAT domain-containing protein [Gemmatimonadetes bacterium]|nr:CHAT domain-containing protein [Gemmatimonadota bacterium]
MGKLRVLFLAADPFADEPASRLRIDEETRAIQARVRESKFRDAVEFETRLATRPGDLLHALNEVRPCVVHFSGHGTAEGAIILAGDDGQPRPVPEKALVRLFRAAKDDIRLVVLNACWSSRAAHAIAQVVDAAVGMSAPVADGVSAVFSARLYGGLGWGLSVAAAVEQARVEVDLEDLPGADVPELFGRPDVDLARLVLMNGGPQTPCQAALAVVRDELFRNLGTLSARVAHTLRNVPAGDPVPQRPGEARAAYEDRDRRWFADALRDTVDGYQQLALETAGYASVRLSLAGCDELRRRAAEQAYAAVREVESRLATYRQRLNGLVDGSRTVDERARWTALYSREAANALAILWCQVVEGWAMLDPDALAASIVESTHAPAVLRGISVQRRLVPGAEGRAWALVASAALHAEKAALIQEEMHLSASRAAVARAHG